MKKLNSLITITLFLFLSISFIGCKQETTIEPGMKGKTIMEVVSSNPDLSSLVDALKKTGLNADLSNRASKLTLFAPTNAAFASLLPELGVSSLNDIPNETLKKVLLYHVLGSKVTAAQISTGYYSTLSKGPEEGSKLSMYIDTHPFVPCFERIYSCLKGNGWIFSYTKHRLWKKCFFKDSSNRRGKTQQYG